MKKSLKILLSLICIGLTVLPAMTQQAENIRRPRSPDREEGKASLKNLTMELGLNEEQKANIQQQLHQNREILANLHEERNQLRQKIEELFTDENIDDKTVMQTTENLAKVNAEITRQQIAGRLAVRRELTPRQHARWQELRRDMHKKQRMQRIQQRRAAHNTQGTQDMQNRPERRSRGREFD